MNGNYQAVNLLADDPNAHLWPQPRSAEDLRENGIRIQLGLPSEIQYIALRAI